MSILPAFEKGNEKMNLAKRMKKPLLCALLVLIVFVFAGCDGEGAFKKKAALLEEQLVNETMEMELGTEPAEGVGHAVFFSVSDTNSRAKVYSAVGEDLESAWDAAVKKTAKAIDKEKIEPTWVKADVVYISDVMPMEQLNEAIGKARNEFLRYGVAFDAEYKTALL
jgi:hypothetical protein